VRTGGSVGRGRGTRAVDTAVTSFWVGIGAAR
jgi:hypothetical protein